MGVRIVEISGFVAVPLAEMTLAQLGAELVRIDPIGGAADYHRWPVTDAGDSIYSQKRGSTAIGALYRGGE